MKKDYHLALIISLSLFCLTSCMPEKAVHTTREVSPASGESQNSTFPNTAFYMPYTGERVSDDQSHRIAVMAVIENSKAARPQSGLNKADIVYETMAEGGIPRFIALFQKNTASKVGPIRSARPYFLDISEEYHLPFAHCGGSEEALMTIKQNHLMSMNEMTNGAYYWRDMERKAPHNLYTSTEELRRLAAVKGYVQPRESFLRFSKDYWNNTQLLSAQSVVLKLNRYYTTSYTYKDGVYYKSMDGVPTLNKEDKVPVTAKNIVIQATSISLQKDGQHLNIALTGKGEGYVISSGKFKKITWVKENDNAVTKLYDAKQREISFSPGNTWWHIIDRKSKVEIM